MPMAHIHISDVESSATRSNRSGRDAISSSRLWTRATFEVKRDRPVVVVKGSDPPWWDMAIGVHKLLPAVTRHQSFYGWIPSARLAQSVERETLNLKVVGSTPTSGSIPASD
ncbi:hypothetical protein CGRA01v4_05514 [Colletotrichum graminicola]|nr:hypothetical protein CGRA01v4_05514 [Colletotrichum graminicola]